MVLDPVSADRSWICDGRFDDIDAQAAQYSGYDQRYQQLSRGAFEGRFRSFHFGDDLVIHLESANREIAASASTPAGRFGVCLLTDDSPPCSLNATEFSQSHIIVSPGKRCVEGIMSEGVTIYCMDVSPSLFPDAGDNMKAVGVLEDPLRSGRLRELVQSGLATFTALSGPAEYPAALCGFKSSVADLLSQATMRPSESEVIGTRRYASARALRVFRRARDYMEHNLCNGIAILNLCKEVGVSRRSLESVFKSVVGLSPGSYIRALQLNGVRRELLSGATVDTSIGVIAARYGIWHWSRFSHAYRELFGELPSQTRARLSLAKP